LVSDSHDIGGECYWKELLLRSCTWLM